MSVFKQGEEYIEDNNNTDEVSNKPKRFNTKFIALSSIALILSLSVIYTVFNFGSNKSDEEIEDEFYEPISDIEYDSDNTNDYIELSFDEETRKTLRVLGYTGDEIDYAYKNGISSDNLIKEAEIDFKNRRMKEFKELSKKSKNSDLLYLFTETQAYLRDLPVPKKNQIEGLIEERLNVDYVKVSPKGNQLYIKLDLGKIGTSFMLLDVTDYISLKKKGNIVVDVTYRKIGKHYYVINLEEVKY